MDFRGGLDDAETFHCLLAGIRGVAPGPGPISRPDSSLQAETRVDAGRPAVPMSSERERLRAEPARLQTQYDTWSRRIAALDTDIGRALGSLEKQVPEERRAELVAEREMVAGQMRHIEAHLGMQ